MSSKIYRFSAVILLLVASLVGCGKQENKVDDKQASIQEAMPDATPETCTLENKKKYGPDFAHKCMFDLGKYTKSSGRAWKF